MISQTDIQATCDDIVREFAPLQIILFSPAGSPRALDAEKIISIERSAPGMSPANLAIPAYEKNRHPENKPNSTYRCRITKGIWKRKTQILTKMQKSYKIKSVFNFLSFHT